MFNNLHSRGSLIAGSDAHSSRLAYQPRSHESRLTTLRARDNGLFQGPLVLIEAQQSAHEARAATAAGRCLQRDEQGGLG